MLQTNRYINTLVNPTTLVPSNVKLLICPRKRGYGYGYSAVSHTGLATSATNTARVLRNIGVNVVVRPVDNFEGIVSAIKSESPTHVVINALWLPTEQLAKLITTYYNITFTTLVHSNIAFLQVEPTGIKLLREAMDLELSSIGNYNLSANSRLGVKGIQDAYEAPITYLPNLYFLDDTVRTYRPKWHGGTLRIGAFGALRPLKNPTGSAMAALAIASNLGTNLEFHINTGRTDGGGSDTLLFSLRAIFQGLPNARLVEDVWQQWGGFRRLVRHMHLLLQPSFTETFNVVTADGVAEGVPSVVSDVIEWVPDHWKVAPDNTNDIARVGRGLLSDAHTGEDGVRALLEHDRMGVTEWVKWLT